MEGIGKVGRGRGGQGGEEGNWKLERDKEEQNWKRQMIIQISANRRQGAKKEMSLNTNSDLTRLNNNMT